MKVPIEHFEGQEIERVYLAVTLDEAKKVEEALDTSSFTYTLDLEKFAGEITGFIGGGVGVSFLVVPSDAQACKRFLRERGLTAHLQEDEVRETHRKHGLFGSEAQGYVDRRAWLVAKAAAAASVVAWILWRLKR